MKYILILGNITFHHFVQEELALFRTNTENKALIHKIDSVLMFDRLEDCYHMADEAESYIILNEFNGEFVFEEETVRDRFLVDINSLISKEEVRDLIEAYQFFPSKKEIEEEMELHNSDEVGINNQWSFDDAEYHLILSDKFYNCGRDE